MNVWLFIVIGVLHLKSVGAQCSGAYYGVGSYQTGGGGSCSGVDESLGTQDCEPYTVSVTDANECGTSDCNGRTSCTTSWCTFFCCETIYDQCPNTCNVVRYNICTNCEICLLTPSPTRFPTNRPTLEPTLYPTRAPSKAPVPTFSPTSHPSKSPTPYPTLYPTQAPTYFPTLFPTDSPVPPTTPDPTQAPIPTPQPTPPTVSPTLFPTSSPSKAVLLSEANLLLFGTIFGVGGGLAIAAFIIVYRRRRSNYDGFANDYAMDKFLAKDQQHKSVEGIVGLSNPMFKGNKESAYDSLINPKDTTVAPPKANRASLNHQNAHMWLQDLKEEKQKKKTEYDNALKMIMRYDFNAEDGEELTASKGTILFCLDKREDWFVGMNPKTGESGLIPVSYVQEYLDDDDF